MPEPFSPTSFPSVTPMALSPAKEKLLALYHSAKIQEIQEAAIRMERAGFLIDVDYLNSQAAIARKDHDAALHGLREAVGQAGIPVLPGVDDIWASPQQLVKLLHDSKLGLRVPPSPYWFKGRVKLDKGERKTDRTALEWLTAQLAAGQTGAPIREWQRLGWSPGDYEAKRRVIEGLMELRRIRSSLKYLEKLPLYVGPDGFVHPVCGPAGDEDDRVGAVTGRFGMKNPEGQQIPKNKRKDLYHIRRAFIAPSGQLLVVQDFSALEVVIFANICEWLWGDTQLLDLTGPGQDIHGYNAFHIFGKTLKWATPSGRRLDTVDSIAEFKTDPELVWYRETVKATWYKLQYGGTVHGFATSLKDPDGNPIGKSRAEEILGALYEVVPAVPKWQDFVASILRRDGGIAAFDGRYVDFTDLIAMGDWGRSSAERKGQNFPMQAGGAHIIGLAMVEASRSRELERLGAILELQVHDELRWRCPEQNAQKVFQITKEIMESAFPLKNLRTEGGIGHNWEACK